MGKYHKYQILSSKIGKVGHEFTVVSGDEQGTTRFFDVRGGWAWPTDTSPFYCIILAQDWFDAKLYYDKSASFTVIFEYIDRGLDLERRFNELADISSLYRCNFYADLAPLHEPASDSWYEYRVHKGLNYGDLEAGPWSDNFRLGVELLKTSVRTHKLEIPKTTEVCEQMKRITETDLANSDVKSQFFTIEALRHAVAGFKRDPADIPEIDTSKFRAERTNNENWML